MKFHSSYQEKNEKQSTLQKRWKMAMVVTEGEGYQKRQYACMQDGETPQAKSVKRRRRDSNASVVGNTEQGCYSTSVPKTVKRSSRFRGVSRHKWTGRYEAHLWDKLTWNVTQKKKGKQVYLGAYDDEEAAARAYDLAALKYWGTSTFTNFPISEHEKEIEIMQTATRQEYLATLRRKSSGFSRGTSMYRGGVPRHHQNGKWEDMIGSVFSNKSLYLGTCNTQEGAARANDIAPMDYRGINAITNFDLTTNITWLNSGQNNSVPVEERRTSAESEEALSSLCSGIKLHYVYLPAKSCRINAMNTQENYGRSVSFSSCRRSSSPTALDLLLRSSVFKELVEKNSNLSEKESNEENAKTLQQGMYSHNPFSHNFNNH